MTMPVPMPMRSSRHRFANATISPSLWLPYSNTHTTPGTGRGRIDTFIFNKHDRPPLSQTAANDGDAGYGHFPNRSTHCSSLQSSSARCEGCALAGAGEGTACERCVMRKQTAVTFALVVHSNQTGNVLQQVSSRCLCDPRRPPSRELSTM